MRASTALFIAGISLIVLGAFACIQSFDMGTKMMSGGILLLVLAGTETLLPSSESDGSL